MDVKDNNTGLIESNKITYRVERFYINTPCITASRPPSGQVAVNTPIQLKANVLGKDLSYKFVWMRNNWNSWDVIRKFTKDDTCTWTPTKPGDYTLYLDVKDASGIVKTQTIKYRVAAAPKSVAKLTAPAARPAAKALPKPAATPAPKSAALTKPVPKPAAKAAPKPAAAAPKSVAKPVANALSKSAAKAAPKSAAPAKPVPKPAAKAAPKSEAPAKPAQNPTQAWNITGVESTISCPAVGETAILTAKVNGNKDGLKIHAFSWRNETTGKSGTICQNNLQECLSVDWTPNEPGDYIVSLTVKDRNNMEKSMQESVLVTSEREYVGIINRYHECALMSTCQLLFNYSEFRNLVLGLEIKDEKRQPYTSKLQKQFRNMNENPDSMEVSFSEDEVESLTLMERQGAVNYGPEDDNNQEKITSTEIRLLTCCIEECRNVGDVKTVESIRDMFDFNYAGKDDKETSLCFVKVKREDGFEETLKEARRIPKSINICQYLIEINLERLNQVIEVDKDGVKRKFELRRVLVHTGSHYYVVVKDLDTKEWIELNDKVVRKFGNREHPGNQMLQCVFEEVK